MTATVRDEHVHVNGINLHYRDWGGHGQPIALLHGLASNAHIWDAVAPMLATGHRVVAVDQRGHGESTKPDEGYDFPTVAADLAALIDALGWPRATLVGHSWGGNVALQFGATHPEATAALVFVDGGFLDLRSDGATWEKIEVDLAPPDMTSMTLDQLLEEGRHWNAETGWTPAVEATLRGSFRSVEDGTIRPQLSRENHMRILRSMWEQDPASLYARVDAPVLIIPAYRHPEGQRRGWEERKDIGVEAAAAALPSARVLPFENTIHDVPLQRPAELAEAILSFLREPERT